MTIKGDADNQRGRDPLMSLTRGRPRGVIVHCRPSFAASRCVHRSVPNGDERFTARRNASSSSSPSAWFTRRSQSAGFSTGHALTNFF